VVLAFATLGLSEPIPLGLSITFLADPLTALW
jgi:hypothetical protein